jgi:hypothetical protein
LIGRSSDLQERCKKENENDIGQETWIYTKKRGLKGE